MTPFTGGPSFERVQDSLRLVTRCKISRRSRRDHHRLPPCEPPARTRTTIHAASASAATPAPTRNVISPAVISSPWLCTRPRTKCAGGLDERLVDQDTAAAATAATSYASTPFDPSRCSKTTLAPSASDL